VHLCSSLQAHKNVANLCRQFRHQKETCLLADLEKQIEVSSYLLPEQRQKPHIQYGWGCYEEIVFNELIRFDQAAIPVMISQ